MTVVDATRTGRADDPHDLFRFVAAQGDGHGHVLRELHAGRKESHWMWFTFPQMLGLGRTEKSVRYGIRSIDEARAYLHHPVLGARLMECAEAVLSVDGRTAHEIFGTPDDVKLRSSATLFALASATDSVFHRLLDTYFNGTQDNQTLELLKAAGPS